MITAVVNFLIVAAVIYIVIVRPLNTLKAQRKRGEESGPAEPTDVELLAEIRDLLADRGRHGTTGRPVVGDGRSDERRV